MKVTVNTLKEFQPIELVLTIESKRELEALASLFNANGENLASFANKNMYANTRSDFSDGEMEFTYHIFDKLDEVLTA